ncbi:unnamed protein product [Didymodactylos carnosus]|uniref:RING-type domain-containing protein n=1 Tax=Didymodactylos carnosus TaxID=1234261 RepID=A0A813V7B6_9BILA|nr:unnamed protein product [Didymodactylos carnosus]CAF1253417.1 unnamed protein product [Didymodactylos carnosus]CAF3620766.1 unnamed protein product [Didymodactylos carnosus]CAF4060518.1 unnamed protein product [Didymodactylos carnosus]
MEISFILLFILLTSCITSTSSLTINVLLEYEYFIPNSYTNRTSERIISGLVSSTGKVKNVNGPVYVLISSSNSHDACKDPLPTLTPSVNPPWIAIITRGGDCSFTTKIQRAKNYGAQAVLIYDPFENDNKLYDMIQNCSDMLAVYIQRSLGQNLLYLAIDRRAKLNITIEPTRNDDLNRDIFLSSKQATIFVAASVCILICLCLSWLLFYYCQRRRTRTAKDRFQQRLKKAAKTVLNKIPLLSVNEDPSTEQICVICLDSIKTGNILRQLVCGHAFHQDCVDPWLLDKRHCPLCNLDILTAYRVSIPREAHLSIISTVSNSSGTDISYTFPTTATSNRINDLALPFARIHQIQDNDINNSRIIPSISATVNNPYYQPSLYVCNDDHHNLTLSSVSSSQHVVNIEAFNERDESFGSTNPIFNPDDEKS